MPEMTDTPPVPTSVVVLYQTPGGHFRISIAPASDALTSRWGEAPIYRYTTDSPAGRVRALMVLSAGTDPLPEDALPLGAFFYNGRLALPFALMFDLLKQKNLDATSILVFVPDGAEYNRWDADPLDGLPPTQGDA